MVQNRVPLPALGSHRWKLGCSYSSIRLTTSRGSGLRALQPWARFTMPETQPQAVVQPEDTTCTACMGATLLHAFLSRGNFRNPVGNMEGITCRMDEPSFRVKLIRAAI